MAWVWFCCLAGCWACVGRQRIVDINKEEKRTEGFWSDFTIYRLGQAGRLFGFIRIG